MKTVGTRGQPPLLREATGEALAAGARFRETLSHLAPSTGISRGVYYFASHAAANEHQQNGLARAMALRAKRTAADDSTSRPATLADLKVLLSSLAEHRVDYLLIGGYALAAHGYVRATSDIDLLCPADTLTRERLQAALSALPDPLARALEPAWFEQRGRIRVAHAFVLDVVFNVSDQTYSTLLDHRQWLELAGIPVATVSLEGLLLTKQTPRPQDGADAQILQQALADLKPSHSDATPP